MSRRLWRGVTRNLVGFYAALALLYLFLPVFVVIVFSFNDNVGRFNFTWQGFTLDSWLNPCGVAGLCQAMIRSIQIAIVSTIVATALGTMVAFALVRHRFRGRAMTNLLIFLPMASPEVVLGSAMLALFLNVGVRTGFLTILLGHIMFNISYVVVTVKARLLGMDSRLEEAAMDLYADEWQTFRRVTLPLVTPGVVAAALLAFALSFDDFIITLFNSGNTTTFPLFVYGAAQRGIPPQINVMGTALFAVAFVVLLVGQVTRRFRRS
ncbi:ABC transporter permease [soil metagenome]|jgi:spermidine/putrescine transport system permease protein|nr:ABC transporter permease [Euzebyaceae bacterium]